MLSTVNFAGPDFTSPRAVRCLVRSGLVRGGGGRAKARPYALRNFGKTTAYVTSGRRGLIYRVTVIHA
jgi:hypothetical protein